MAENEIDDDFLKPQPTPQDVKPIQLEANSRKINESSDYGESDIGYKDDKSTTYVFPFDYKKDLNKDS
jgi:hypothetical protein